MIRRQQQSERSQMELGLQPRFGWGGERAGAGRKASKGSGVSHKVREEHVHRHPSHVTLRVVREVGYLRADKPFAAIQAALRAAKENGRAGFRVVQYSVQGNHLHLIVEADDRVALSRGMQGLCIRIAKAVNRVLRRHGPVFSDRYHRRDLKSPRETRNALAYVLQNFRRHAAQRGERCGRGWTDPCSSAEFFDGWSRARRFSSPHSKHSPVAPPGTWLLRTGWRRYGLISPDEIPGR
jgi:REP element-mobilizing transposase RayT